MSATCPNCGAALNCSCQLRVASDGKKTCTACLANYEATLKIVNESKKKST